MKTKEIQIAISKDDLLEAVVAIRGMAACLDVLSNTESNKDHKAKLRRLADKLDVAMARR